MNAPLTREQQIELMRDADKRMDARAQKWLRARPIRRALTRPAPGQEEGTYQIQTVRVTCR